MLRIHEAPVTDACVLGDEGRHIDTTSWALSQGFLRGCSMNNDDISLGC